MVNRAKGEVRLDPDLYFDVGASSKVQPLLHLLVSQSQGRYPEGLVREFDEPEELENGLCLFEKLLLCIVSARGDRVFGDDEPDFLHLVALEVLYCAGSSVLIPYDLSDEVEVRLDEASLYQDRGNCYLLALIQRGGPVVVVVYSHRSLGFQLDCKRFDGVRQNLLLRLVLVLVFELRLEREVFITGGVAAFDVLEWCSEPTQIDVDVLVLSLIHI